ncbi:hypothetical protein D3C84_935300 [compost metagenome]
MPVTALIAGQGWIGALLWVVAGIVVPRVLFRKKDRNWRDIDLSQLLAWVEESEYTKFEYKRELSDIARFNNRYAITAMRRGRGDSVVMSVQSTYGSIDEFTLPGTSLRGYRNGNEIGGTRLMDKMVLRIGPFRSKTNTYDGGYLVFGR